MNVYGDCVKFCLIALLGRSSVAPAQISTKNFPTKPAHSLTILVAVCTKSLMSTFQGLSNPTRSSLKQAQVVSHRPQLIASMEKVAAELA